ncbi:MAG TPA: hypothetical protein VGK19_21780 [Capsulimonadaceae bacterium]|jgi:hypothetical protein
MIARLRMLVDWYFADPDIGIRRGPLSIIGWWELRRFVYNIIVAVAGSAGIVVYYFFIHCANGLAPGDDLIEPFALMAAPFLVNIAYTAGWFCELILNYSLKNGSEKAGPVLLKLGTGFSLLVVFLPGAMWGFIYLYRPITKWPP